MTKENISAYFRLTKIDETRNYLLQEIKQGDLMRKKHKKVSTTLNYFKKFLMFVFYASECVSISAFASLVGIPMGIMSSTVGLWICALAAAIKSVNQLLRKKKKKHDKIVLIGKSKLNTIEVLISKVLICFSDNALKECNEMKEAIQHPLSTMSDKV